MFYGVGLRCSSDPELLWLWHRPAATALIRPLAWETSRTVGMAQKKKKKKKKRKKERKKERMTEKAGATSGPSDGGQATSPGNAVLEFPLWLNRISSILGALGCRFDP